MNRREMFKALGALPLAIVGVASVKSIGGMNVPASSVKAGSITVRESLDGLSTFWFTMVHEPWPEAGQSIEIRHGDMYLSGEVQRVGIEAWGPEGVRFLCRVQGVVTSYRLPEA